jgi:hypothetical protein
VTALEIRILGYALAALIVLGGSFYAGHHVASIHYEARIAADRAAQDKALSDAKDHEIVVLKAQQAATQAAESQYAELKARADNLGGQLADSVRQYASLHSGLLSTAASAAALADATRQGADRDRELAELARQAATACLGDAATLTGLQTWAKR